MGAVGGRPAAPSRPRCPPRPNAAQRQDARLGGRRGAAAAPRRSIAGAELTARIEPTTPRRWNVAGLLPGRDGRAETRVEWVVGAHYDHLGHGGTSASRAPGAREMHAGADDNASGTALLLEVARRFAATSHRV